MASLLYSIAASSVRVPRCRHALGHAQDAPIKFDGYAKSSRVLVDSVVLIMPLMMEPKEIGLLNPPSLPPDTHIIDALFLQRVALVGLAIALPGFLLYDHLGAAAVVNGVVVDELL